MSKGNKTVVVAHVIASQDPQDFHRQLTNFQQGKNVLQVFISTSAVFIGGNQVGGGQLQAQMLIVTSAYIEFECTEEQERQFRVHQSLLIKK